MHRFTRLMLTLLLLLHALPALAAEEQFGPPQAPSGFRIEPVIQNLHHPTRLAFGPDGRLYVAQQTGEVIAIALKDGQEASRDQVAEAKLHLLGIALKDDKLWVSDTGAIAVYTRNDQGRYEGRKEIVSDIPHGLHQNDGFAWGPDGKLYWGLGSTTDRGPEQHPWSGAILRMNPDGSEIEVFARGFRNPYGIAFDGRGNLWVTDNGADDPVSSDELNLVVQGGDYGFPRVFGMPPDGSPVQAPIALFGDHNSTNGIAFDTGNQFPDGYRGAAFVAMWGSSFDDNVGRAVGLVRLNEQGGAYQAEVTTFVTGLNRPLDLIIGPAGDLWIADFVPGIVYRVWYEGQDEAGETGAREAVGQQGGDAKPTEVAEASQASVGTSLPLRWILPLAVLLLTAGIALFRRR